MDTSRLGRRAAVLGVVALGALPATALAAKTHTLRDSAPDWAKPSAQVGNVASGAQQNVRVYLELRDEAGMQALADAVADPDGAQYGQFLTAAQFRQRFAPATADVKAVRTWLRRAGLRVTGDTPASRRWVDATGDATVVERAFGRQLKTYRHDGATVQAPDGDLKLPTTISGIVSSVGGLDNGTRMRPATAGGSDDVAQTTPDAPPSPAFVNAGPCSTYFGEKTATGAPPAYGRVWPYAPCGYVPAQLQGAYGIAGAIAKGVDGRGQTVAITDAFDSPTIRQDANTYAARHGQGPVNLKDISRPGLTNVPESGTPASDLCDPQGWYGEQTLDVEAVHAIAPGARIVYSGGEDCLDAGLITAIQKVLDQGQANVISNSWGDIEPNLTVLAEREYTKTFLQAAIQGVGVYFSSGDDGDEIAASGARTADFPASHPLVTAVGGTSLGVGAKNEYLFESAWGTANSLLTDGAWTPTPPGDYLYGAGGGTSQIYPEPPYQRGVVPASEVGVNGSGGRVVPDVSMVGDPQTGMLVGQTQTFTSGAVKYSEYRIGGTSLSSPLFAATMVLADQVARRPHGFANPLLYRRAGTSAYHDITPLPSPLAVVRNDFVNSEDASGGLATKLRTFQQLGTLEVLKGYDDVTGVGSPNGEAFLAALARRRH